MITIIKSKGRLIEIPSFFMNFGDRAAIIGDALETQDWDEFGGIGDSYSIEFRNAQDEIPPNAFAGDENLRRVMSATVRTVRSMAFFDCANLESACFPGIRAIGSRAFQMCKNLKIIQADAVESLSSDAFSFCPSLEKISLPSTLSDIDRNVFAHCQSLKFIETDHGNELYESSRGILYNTGRTLIIAYPAGKREAVFESRALEVGDNAFGGCRYLEEVILPDVRRLGWGAFCDCAALRRVFVPSLRSVGKCADMSDDEYEKLYADKFSLRFLDDSGLSNCRTLEAVYLDADNPLLNKLKDVFDAGGWGDLLREMRPG
jgi:hypothetical protein